MKIHYIEYGSGYPIILLHGFPFNNHLWDPLLPLFYRGNRYIFPDLRGFGKSMVTDSEYDMHDMAQDVITLMENLKLKKAIIFGHSMGGYVALEVLRQAPDYIAGIALIASHIYADPFKKQKSRLETVSRLRSENPIRIFHELPKKLSLDKTVKEYCRKAIKKAKPIGLQGAMKAMAHRSSSEAIWVDSEIPKLIVAGEDDQFISREINKKMARSGRNVTFEVLEDAGHMLMREFPERTVSVMDKFISLCKRH